MKAKILLLVTLVICMASLTVMDVAVAADFGREVHRGSQFAIYETSGKNDTLIVTARLIDSYSKKEDFARVTEEVVVKMKELYSKNYTLNRADQRVFSSGELKSPNGKAFNDCKTYLLHPRKDKKHIRPTSGLQVVW